MKTITGGNMSSEIIYVVYDEQGNERASVMVGSPEAGDEITADREMRREAEQLQVRFGGTFRVERHLAEVE